MYPHYMYPHYMYPHYMYRSTYIACVQSARSVADYLYLSITNSSEEIEEEKEDGKDEEGLGGRRHVWRKRTGDD